MAGTPARAFMPFAHLPTVPSCTMGRAGTSCSPRRLVVAPPPRNSLRSSYLGYVVVRPQPSVPIGRTVLRPEGASPATMNAWVQSRYGAHVMGMSLKVEGLAFQQQDRAVGACATTAVWTALQQTCKRESDRPPTPSAITQGAWTHLSPRAALSLRPG